MTWFNRKKQRDTGEWREMPTGITRIDLITAKRGPRTIETKLTLDQIEDLIKSAQDGADD